MNAHTDLQDPSQRPLEQLRANSLPSSHSLAPPAVPQPDATPLPPPVHDIDAINAKAQKGRRNAELRDLSKRFGAIPNVPIFTVWDKRQDCCDAAVHRPTMAGIFGNEKVGTFSIVLSSLYKDDEDRGDVIIYTGTGGRERWSNSFPPKRLRVGPQTEDQSWDHKSNKALMVSSDTGEAGYRYDGLYRITSCWSARGSNGKMICRCRLERLPGQPPVPERPLTLSTSKRRKERLVSSSDNQPSPPHREVIPEINYDVGNADLDIKEDPQPPPPRTRTTPVNLEALPRYRWDARMKQLIKIFDSYPNPAVGGEGEEGCRGEDDAVTLVPSEDDPDMAVERAASTEYFSEPDSARFETPDEPRPSGSSAIGDSR